MTIILSKSNLHTASRHYPFIFLKYTKRTGSEIEELPVQCLYVTKQNTGAMQTGVDMMCCTWVPAS